MRNHVQGLISNSEILEQFYPSVLISYGTGRRAGDAEGCGPGMYYTQRIAKMLEVRGVASFSGLHVVVGVDWHVFLDKLCGRFSECRVLVVVVTPALFQSKPCLEELNGAVEAGMHIVRTRLPALFYFLRGHPLCQSVLFVAP